MITVWTVFKSYSECLKYSQWQSSTMSRNSNAKIQTNHSMYLTLSECRYFKRFSSASLEKSIDFQNNLSQHSLGLQLQVVETICCMHISPKLHAVSWFRRVFSKKESREKTWTGQRIELNSNVDSWYEMQANCAGELFSVVSHIQKIIFHLHMRLDTIEMKERTH